MGSLPANSGRSSSGAAFTSFIVVLQYLLIVSSQIRGQACFVLLISCTGLCLALVEAAVTRFGCATVCKTNQEVPGLQRDLGDLYSLPDFSAET